MVLLRTFLKPRTNWAHRRLDAEHPALLLEIVVYLEILLVAIYTIYSRYYFYSNVIKISGHLYFSIYY